MILALTPSAFLPESDRLLEIGARLALTLLAAFVLLQLGNLVVARIEKWVTRAGDGSAHALQRARTVGQILRNLAAVLVIAGATVHALDLFGWDVKPLLAGAGILGVALGFGAQTLVRDVIAGFFILAEDQFGVGDLIEVNGAAATVEEVTVRSTRLRDFNGYVHFVPNGEMKIVTNRSRGWNRVAVDVMIAADEDLDRALKVCREVVDRMNSDPEWRDRLLDPIALWGVESLIGQEVQVRMVVRARPGPDAPEAGRELRRRIHLALAEAKVRTRSSPITLTSLGATEASVPAGQPSPLPPS